MKQDSCTACSAECPVFIFYKNANDSEKKRSEFELLFACTHALMEEFFRGGSIHKK